MTDQPHGFLKLVGLLALLVFSVVADSQAASAQATPTSTPDPTVTPTVPMSPPNLLLIYDKTSLAMINTSQTPLSLTGMTFSRAGGVVKFSVPQLASSLAPGHCIQWWVASVRQVLGQPPECGTRDRYLRLTQDKTYFWVPGYDNEPFRPELTDRTLAICNASATRCAFNLPQGDAAKQPWPVLEPDLNTPLPAGMQVAYDANQIWIGNLTPDTVLTTARLRLFYPVNNKGTVWTPSVVQWDGIGAWDRRNLQNGQCLVLYQDATKVTPLLPCTPIAMSLNADHPWTLRFEVMGPREERRATCGDGKPTTGPVLCLLPG